MDHWLVGLYPPSHGFQPLDRGLSSVSWTFELRINGWFRFYPIVIGLKALPHLAGLSAAYGGTLGPKLFGH